MENESDRLLVQQIRAGGVGAEQAWGELVSRYEGRLRAYVRRRLRDDGTTDDTVQETFIGFLHSLINFDDKRELQTWLFSIASYKVTDQLRRLGRVRYKTGNESDEEQLIQTSDNRQRAASSLARSKERLEIESDAIARALRDLIQTYRQKGDHGRVQVLELLFVKGLPNWQVAETLKVNEQHVANVRFSAVKVIKESMQLAGLPIDVFPELHTTS